MSQPATVRSTSEPDTVAAGREFAKHLSAGDIVLISGPLGAGKTAFVRGIAEGLGASGSEVSSPTFTLIQEYRGPVPLFHADLYRLTSADVPDLGLAETGESGVLAVEWPDRWNDAPASSWQVSISDDGGDARTIVLAHHSTR